MHLLLLSSESSLTLFLSAKWVWCCFEVIVVPDAVVVVVLALDDAHATGGSVRNSIPLSHDGLEFGHACSPATRCWVAAAGQAPPFV